MKAQNKKLAAVALIGILALASALVYIPDGIELVQSGKFIYTPRNEAPRIITPENSEFLFYSQAAFLFSFGIWPLSLILAILASYMLLGLQKLGLQNSSNLHGVIITIGKSLWYLVFLSSAAVFMSIVAICVRPLVS